MSLEKEIKLSVLQTYETFEDLLINLFGASRREIKKFILNKKVLKKKSLLNQK